MRQAVDCGIALFGENHAQELVEKKTFFELNRCSVHFIGQLQTNKIKCIIGSMDMVESVDRVRLANALNERAKALDIVSDILLQVNIGNEPQKGGVAEADLDLVTDTIAALHHLRLRGLMCVPPALPSEQTRPYFRRMKTLFDALAGRFGPMFDTLSMGMSHDYPVAVEEGATQIRLGSALFGARDRSLSGSADNTADEAIPRRGMDGKPLQ